MQQSLGLVFMDIHLDAPQNPLAASSTVHRHW
jgi:hypothetical protein